MSLKVLIKQQLLHLNFGQIEKELFEIPVLDLKYSSMYREEWQAVRSLADDRSIVIKKNIKGFV